MSLITAQLTLTGGNDNLATVGLSNGVALGDKGICQMIIWPVAATVQFGQLVGGSTATTTPNTLYAVGTSPLPLQIGPFDGAPTRTKEWFFKGTASQVLNISLITR